MSSYQMRENIIDYLIQYLSDEYSVKIDRKTCLGDIGIDSLDFFNLVAHIESQYNIEFHNADLLNWKYGTIENLASIVDYKINGNS